MIKFRTSISGKALENMHQDGEWDTAKIWMTEKVGELVCEQEVKVVFSLSLPKVKGDFEPSVKLSYVGEWEGSEEFSKRLRKIFYEAIDKFSLRSRYTDSQEYKQLLKDRDLALELLRKRMNLRGEE